MKIIQVSDLHLVQPGGKLFGLDPLVRLEDCIADLNRNHADADLVVFSGDLTDNGDHEAYAALSERLVDLAAPFRLMIGNHDDRAAFLTAFPGVEAPDGFVQSAIDLPSGRVVLLDTHAPGHVEGRLCETRLDWLDAVLREAGRSVFLFLHHPPLRIGIPSIDDSRLMDGQNLLAVLRRHDNVRHIFAGHVHRAIAGTWSGIPFSTLRGTNHQSALNFSGPYAISLDAPAYNVILVKGGDVVVHMHEFPVSARS